MVKQQQRNSTIIHDPDQLPLPLTPDDELVVSLMRGSRRLSEPKVRRLLATVGAHAMTAMAARDGKSLC